MVVQIIAFWDLSGKILISSDIIVFSSIVSEC